MATKLVEQLIGADTVRVEWRHDIGWCNLNGANIYLLSAGVLSTRIENAISAVYEFEDCFDDTSYRIVHVTGNTSTTTSPMTVTKLIGTLVAWGLATGGNDYDRDF